MPKQTGGRATPPPPPPPRKRWGLNGLRAAGALACALAVLGVLASTAYGDLLTGNFGQRYGGRVSGATALDHAQGFTTGGHAAGYTLDSVELRFASRSAAAAPTVTVRSDSPAGVVVAALSGPSTVGGGDVVAAATFSAPAGTALDAGTTYFVRIEGGGTVDLAFTDASAEDAGGSAGWSIGDLGHYRIAGSGAPFETSSSVKFVRVNGTPVAVHRDADGTASVAVGDDGRVRIEVPSAADRYHVLHYRPDADDAAVEHPVALHRGAAGSVVLTEPLRAGSGSYRVATHLDSAPADTDGDGTDDLAELARSNAGDRAPLNAGASLELADGATAVPDLATFWQLSRVESHRALALPNRPTREYAKFIVAHVGTEHEVVYFMNVNRWTWHHNFAHNVLDWPRYENRSPRHVTGELVYHPHVVAPSGEVGTFHWQDAYAYAPKTFEIVVRTQEALAASMPFLRNNLVAYPIRWDARTFSVDQPLYSANQAAFEASRVPVYFDGDLFAGSAYQALNPAVGYGLLRVLGGGERPTFRDVVILRRLPNELPAVAGVVSLERQTPLSHVNLRAVQDGVPNAYLGNALDDPAVAGLVGRYVRYEVDADPERRFAWTDPGTGERIERAGFRITEATAEEVAAHHAARRPAAAQTPARDLSVRQYRALAGIGFDDADAFGAKAANVAVLRTLGLADVEVPDGYALPFHFYDAFMRHNGFYDDIDGLLADAAFRAGIAVRDAALAKLRRRIRNGSVPEAMARSLAAVQALFPAGTAIRCRSSTNNEDLPGFSGAGLYDSFTHHPDEGHLSKSVRQVFASLWNLRAFEEREFHRVDHKAAAMGVLLHPNFSDERVNGVAVSADPLYGTADAYYVNAQVGEELVTNPSALAVPEVLLLNADGALAVTVMSRSNLVADGERVLGDAHAATLRTALGTIHERFATLYGVAAGDAFAMEVEFKVTAAGAFAIKQARPWVY